MRPLITSRQNPLIKEIVHLRERRTRDRTGQFLIEGYREILRSIEGNYPLSHLLFCPPLFLGSNEESLLDQIENRGGRLFSCTEEVFRKISYRDRPDGLLAVAPQINTPLSSLSSLLITKPSPPFLLVAEQIEKPGNLGTILRSADAAGVDALILADPRTDLFNPNVVRASVGTLFTVPVFQGTGQEVLGWLRENRIVLVAATPHATTLYTQADFSIPLAIAVGTEQLGLSKEWIDGADSAVRIPMQGAADSLNVATATTLLLFEVVRQRRGGA